MRSRDSDVSHMAYTNPNQQLSLFLYIWRLNIYGYYIYLHGYVILPWRSYTWFGAGYCAFRCLVVCCKRWKSLRMLAGLGHTDHTIISSPQQDSFTNVTYLSIHTSARSRRWPLSEVNLCIRSHIHSIIIYAHPHFMPYFHTNMVTNPCPKINASHLMSANGKAQGLRQKRQYHSAHLTLSVLQFLELQYVNAFIFISTTSYTHVYVYSCSTTCTVQVRKWISNFIPYF